VLPFALANVALQEAKFTVSRARILRYYAPHMLRMWSRIRHEYLHFVWWVRCTYWKFFLKSLGRGSRFYGPVTIGGSWMVSIGKHSTLNTDVMINARAPVVIGDYVRIASRVIINAEGLDYAAPRESRTHTAAPVRIEDGVWIGAGAIICAGVTIGEDAAIGAGSVVIQDVPAHSLVFGSPARVVREIAPKTHLQRS
jgi:maltose O-acetyltransferase